MTGQRGVAVRCIGALQECLQARAHRLAQTLADPLAVGPRDHRRIKRSIVVKSNRVVQDWGKCLGDNPMAVAVLDRLMHCAHLLDFEGESYCFHLHRPRNSNEEGRFTAAQRAWLALPPEDFGYYWALA